MKEKYENHHKVRIEDDALIAAVNLSHRYITNRFLPDKAIDLVDEAASKLRLEMNSVPEPIAELNSQIRQLEIEKEAIKREGVSLKLDKIKEQLKDLNDKREVLMKRWDEEKGILTGIQTGSFPGTCVGKRFQYGASYMGHFHEESAEGRLSRHFRG